MAKERPSNFRNNSNHQDQRRAPRIYLDELERMQPEPIRDLLERIKTTARNKNSSSTNRSRLPRMKKGRG